MLRRAIVVIVLAVAACAPSAGPSPTPDPTFASITLPLRTITRDTGACRGIGLRGMRLEGDPSDPSLVWLRSRLGDRQNVIWPPGYTARFGDTLEVLDAEGTVVVRGGDEVTEACVANAAGDSRGLLLIRP